MRYSIVSLLLLLGTASCIHSKGDGPPADPFVGLLAHPSGGAVELQRVGDGPKYRGSLFADYGPFPYEGTRDHDVIHGTVTYGETAHRLDIERTDQGYVLIEDGTRIDPPLQWYKDRNEYAKWQAAHDAFPRGEIAPVPSTRPAR